MATMPNQVLRRHIAVPQDHGSWVFIISPLLIGTAAGGHFSHATFNLIVATLAAFMLRQPVTIYAKILSGRRPSDDLSAARFWMLVYVVIAALSFGAVILEGFTHLFFLIVPAILVFGWHWWLVSRREERKNAGMEIAATAVLSLAAAASYWIGISHYDPLGWWLWILVWIQSSASIVHAYVRLEQRMLDHSPTRRESWRLGYRAFIFTTFNLVSTLTLSLAGLLPAFIFLPYLLQWIETMWGIFQPATGWKPARIGIRQLIVSTVWTLTFILVWR